MQKRDLIGYGANPPHAEWPGGARVAVSLVFNVEEGSERAVSRGDPENEPVYRLYPRPAQPDHGLALRLWHPGGLLADRTHAAPCTLNACAEALAVSPWMARDALARGHEISCHGDRWQTPLGMSEAEERCWIAKAVATIMEVAACAHAAARGRIRARQGFR